MATSSDKTYPVSGHGPPLRQDGDGLDAERGRWSFEAFDCLDGSYRLRDREVEQNIRFLCGQQWWQYHHLLGWKDITYWMSDEEKRWRQRPVFNRLLPWFILTHARMTENSFICSFLPGPDRADEQLAETFDILYKKKWRDCGMTDVWDRCAAWMIASGSGFLNSRIDLGKGEWERWVGRADVPVLGQEGSPLLDQFGQPITQAVPDGVPFDRDGRPLAAIHPDGLRITGKPHAVRKGDLAIDNYSPFEVRGEWGPLPWHMQRRHMARSYLTPEQVWEIYKVECEPDIRGEAASAAGFLERMLFGSGFFGAASSMIGSEFGGTGNAKDGYCCVQTTWEAPIREPKDQAEYPMVETPDQPGGRMLVTSKVKTLRDGARPFAFKYTSPIRCFDMLRLPGRMAGSTPLEIMISPQKAYNTGWKQILENRALCANPQQVYDLRSGLKSDQVDNQPGRRYGVKMREHVEPLKWIVPPAMGADVWRTQDALQRELGFSGSTQGTDAPPVNPDASGELVRELRFNDDRFLGPTMRRSAEESGRMIEDWQVIIPKLYDTKTILNYTGKDNVARTIMLLPEILSGGKIDVVPDVESMLPEGRGERRARVYKMWQDGAWGDPTGPEALRKLHELSQFPHMGRADKPGGIHWTTAEQENGELLQGKMPPMYPWYDDAVHLICLEEFMSAPEWRRLPENIKQLFMEHREGHRIRLEQKRLEMQMKAVEEQQAMNPGEPGGGPGGNGGGPGKPKADVDAKVMAGRGPRPMPARPPAGKAHTPTAAGTGGR